MAENPTEQVLVDLEIARLADVYIELIKELTAISQSCAGLDASLSSLVAVKRFLDANEIIFAAGLTRPLGELAAAINDLQSGTKPKLLEVPKRPNGGRPPRAIDDAVKATAAACLELLHENARETLEVASLYISDELEKIGVKSLGSSTPITQKTIQGWRAEMGSRNSEIANKIFRQIKTDLSAKLGPRTSSEIARRVVRGAIQALTVEGVTPSGK